MTPRLKFNFHFHLILFPFSHNTILKPYSPAKHQQPEEVEGVQVWGGVYTLDRPPQCGLQLLWAFGPVVGDLFTGHRDWDTNSPEDLVGEVFGKELAEFWIYFGLHLIV